VSPKTHRNLQLVRFGGAAITAAAIIGSLYHVVWPGAAFVVMLIFGFPAAMATLALMEANHKAKSNGQL
jgi:hypothetical protein